MEKLDRCLANTSWIDLFPKSSITHFPRTHSNHHPVLADLIKEHNIYYKPFRIETMWWLGTHLTHPLILPLLWVTLSPRSNLGLIKLLETSSIGKNKILARLAEIQESPNYTHSTFLHALEKSLAFEFSNILRQEQDFWKLKSRINWLTEGDDNIKFFHTSTLNRIWRNRTNSPSLMILVISSPPNKRFPAAFSPTTIIFFSGYHSSSPMKCQDNYFRYGSIKTEVHPLLDVVPSAWEIKRAIFHSTSLKLLALMGYTLSCIKVLGN